MYFIFITFPRQAFYKMPNRRGINLDINTYTEQKLRDNVDRTRLELTNAQTKLLFYKAELDIALGAGRKDVIYRCEFKVDDQRRSVITAERRFEAAKKLHMEYETRREINNAKIQVLNDKLNLIGHTFTGTPKITKEQLNKIAAVIYEKQRERRKCG